MSYRNQVLRLHRLRINNLRVTDVCQQMNYKCHKLLARERLTSYLCVCSTRVPITLEYATGETKGLYGLFSALTQGCAFYNIYLC